MGIDNLLSHKWSLPMGNFSPQTPKNIPICFGDYAVGEAMALSSRYRLHPLTTVLSGMLLYPLGKLTVLFERLHGYYPR